MAPFVKDDGQSDGQSGAMVDPDSLESKTGAKTRLPENLDQANTEIERLRKMGDKLSGELQGKAVSVHVQLWAQIWDLCTNLGNLNP